MRTLILFTLSVLQMVSGAVAAKQVSSSLPAVAATTQALALFTKGQKPQAYVILENLFHSSLDAKDKLNAALILTYADNKYLKRAKRHQYAAYVYAQMPESADKASFLRIAGDGYFEDMNLIQAETYYNALMEVSNPLDQDYGHYKMGWIELNRKQPERAFTRWYQRVLDGAHRVQDLRRSLVRDLGRSWAETVPASESETRLVNHLSLSQVDLKEFLDGVAVGMRRLDEKKELPMFRMQLMQTSFVKALLPNILNQGIGMSVEPCSVMSWFKEVQDATFLEVDLILPRLNACNFDLHKKYKERWSFAPETAQLMLFYETLNLKGAQRLARASLYKEAKYYIKACGEYVGIFNEESTVNLKSHKLQEEEKDLIESCRRAATEKSESFAKASDLHKSYNEYLKRNIALGLLQINSEAPLYGLTAYFLKVPAYRAILLNTLLSQEGQGFRGSLIPAQISETMSVEEKINTAEKMLSFVPAPLLKNEKSHFVWIEFLRTYITDLIQKKNWDLAVAALKKFIPLEQELSGNDRRSSLWSMWALALPLENASFRDLGKHVAKLVLKSAASQPELALALGVKYELTADVWQQWAVLRKQSGVNASFIKDYLQKMYADLVSGSVTLDMASKYNDGRFLINALSYVKSHGTSDWDFDAVPQDIQTPDLVHDISFIENLKSHGHDVLAVKLKFNTRLPKLIETQIQKVQSLLDQAKKKTWSHASLGTTARYVIAGVCEGLALKIDHISYPKEAAPEQVQQWQGQLGQISTTVRGWQKTLLADGGL